MNSTPPRDTDAKRELLQAAFSDAETTIRATDTKASIALVVHGFIFAGVLGVISGIGSWFGESGCRFHDLVVVLIGLIAVSFIASVVQILRCVAPAPNAAIPDVPSKGVFYLPAQAGPVKGVARQIVTLDELRQRLTELDDAQILDELMGELIKVSAIRSRKVGLAKSGLILLGVEMGLSVVLLCSIGIHQL